MQKNVGGGVGGGGVESTNYKYFYILLVIFD